MVWASVRTRSNATVVELGELLALLLLFAWLLAGTAAASVDEVGGGAFGESVDVVVGGVGASSGPLPSVTLPSDGGGPFTDTAASADVTAGVLSVLSTDALMVNTQGGRLGSHQGFATSSAQVDAVSILDGVFSADEVSTTCTSNGDGSVGSATFTNAQLGGTTIDANIAPNSSLQVDGVGTFLFNEQVVAEAAGSETSITVNALRVTLDPMLGSGEIIIAQSVCSALGPDVLAAPPVVRDDGATTAEDSPATVDVLANDSDPDGDPLTVTIDTPPANGSATVNPDQTITYIPNPGFTGTDTFTYQACDPDGQCATATVTVTVLSDGVGGDGDGRRPAAGEGLAFTGLAAMPLAAAGVILIAVGHATLAWTGRRRRRPGVHPSGLQG